MEFGLDKMGYGLTVWAIEPKFSEQNLDNTLRNLSEIFTQSRIKGKPIVEVFASDDLDFANAIGKKADHYGLDIVACGFNPGSSPHLVDPDKSKREQAIQRVKNFINFTQEVAWGGPRILTGPFYAEHTRNIDEPFTITEKEYLTENLKQIAEYAASKNVYLAMEILNKGETNVLNKVDGALSLVEKVGSKNLGLHLDTIHQYREEGGLDGIIPAFEKVLQAGCFYHLHLSDDPRTEWGRGIIAPLTTPILQLLKQYNYKGAVVVECFHPDLDELVGITDRTEEQDAISVATRSMKYLAKHIPKN